MRARGGAVRNAAVTPWPMQFFLVLNGQSAGPFEETQVRALLAAGEATPGTLACPVGGTEWRPLGDVLGSSGPAMPLAPYPGPFPAAAPTNGLAIASLVLGCAGLACCGVTSLPAVICGHIALGQLNRAGGAQAGRGLAIAGLVLGYLMVAGAALYLLFFIGIGILGATGGAGRH